MMNWAGGARVGALAMALALSGTAQAADTPPGPRYDLPRYYHSEISPAKAYLLIDNNQVNKKGYIEDDGDMPTVLIDVRTLREYAAGHPEKAFNVPYPNIYGGNDQNRQVFYDEVLEIVNGDLDARVLTLCRTGYRSVLAANILSNPAAHGVTGQPFTNVRNIWEGFVGQYKTIIIGGVTYNLDLNNDGVINTDVADVYSHTADANPDKDGWRNFQELPWTRDVSPGGAYLNDVTLYDQYQQ